MNKEEINAIECMNGTCESIKYLDKEEKIVINQLQQENKQLKDNWNKLKAIAKSQSDLKQKCHEGSLWFEIDELLNKMQELENGEK